jgi:predicted esterase YcpF (UPF0227 family)
MKNDWEVLNKDYEEDTYLIEKQIRKKTAQEIEQDKISEEEYEIVEEYSDYELDFGEFNDFESYANNTMFDEDSDFEDHPSYFQRVVDYTYSWF